MKIIIDADACPAIDKIYELAISRNVNLVIVSDCYHEYNYENIEQIAVPSGENATDFKIVSILEANDIVITQDYALAALVLAKNANAVNPMGFVYDNENIDSLLATRHMNKEARRRGDRLHGKKTPKRKKQDDKRLVETIQSLI